MVYLALILMIAAKSLVLQAVLVQSEKMPREEASRAAFLCFLPALVSLFISLPIAFFALPWAAIGMGMSGHSSNLSTPELICALTLDLPAYYVPFINVAAVPLVYALIYSRSQVKASVWRLIGSYFAVTVTEYVLLLVGTQVIHF